MSFKIARIDRLKKNRDFRRVFDEENFVANAFFSVHLFQNPAKRRRVGISAGKKLGGAVFRNRCKRRIRECYRLNQELFPEATDIVIVARRALVHSKWDKVVKAFLDVAERCGHKARKMRGE